MAKAKIQENLVLITDAIVFAEGEEVYAFWMDSEGYASVDDEADLPEDCEGWTLHIQEIGANGEQIFQPREWDFDYVSDDAVDIIEANWEPIRPSPA